MRRVALVLAVAGLALADDFLIVPGKGFGPFGPSMSLAQMEKKLPQGQFMTGDNTVSLYAMEPEKRIVVQLDGKKKIRSMTVHGTKGVWHTAEGIGLGTPLSALEKANGRPFKFRSLGMDEQAGRVLDWQGGKLARPLARVQLTFASAMHARGYGTLTDEEHTEAEKEGVTLSSDGPLAKKLNPVVETIEVRF